MVLWWRLIIDGEDGLTIKVALPSISEDSLQEMQELTSDEFGVNAFSVSMEGEINERNTKKMLQKGVFGPEGLAMAHSIEAEEEAVMRASTLSNQVNCPLLIKSITSESAADIVKTKKGRGNVLYAEVSPASLACDGIEYWNSCWTHAAGYVTKPPLRKGVADELVENATSSFDVISSGHATYTTKQKALGAKDFTKIPPGINGVGERMMVLWDKLVHSGNGTPEQFVAMTSANAAKMFNLYPDKGRLEVGSQADVVIWDPHAKKTISTGDHNLKTDFNVFSGMAVTGVPYTVIISGRICMDEGQLRVMQGFGKFLPMSAFAPHVYEKVRANEAKARATSAVIRAEIPSSSNGNSVEEMPPPTPTKPAQAEKAPSQQRSQFDLLSHPNGDQALPEPKVTSVKVRQAPGGRSSGAFW